MLFFFKMPGELNNERNTVADPGIRRGGPTSIINEGEGRKRCRVERSVWGRDVACAYAEFKIFYIWDSVQ